MDSRSVRGRCLMHPRAGFVAFIERAPNVTPRVVNTWSDCLRPEPSDTDSSEHIVAHPTILTDLIVPRFDWQRRRLSTAASLRRWLFCWLFAVACST
jgi:hypothetical protein